MMLRPLGPAHRIAGPLILLFLFVDLAGCRIRLSGGGGTPVVDAGTPDDGGTGGLECENGGACTEADGSFVCERVGDFTGPTCSDPRSVGLDARPGNTSCVAPTRVVSSGPIEWQSNDWGGAPGLNLMTMRQLPDGTWTV